MIGTRLGPYLLEKELGSGGMGSVFRAEVVGDLPGLSRGSRVAVKIVHPHLLSSPGFFKRFLREAELGRRVQHECVVRTFDADALVVDDHQVNFMVMEYVEGKSLRDLLTDLRTVPDTLLREIALQAASGLAAIHAEGIVHRDLKPENLLITEDQCIRIMDLGVARLQEATVAITRQGQFAGSLLYAAPEQHAGRPVGPASDLYSLGVLLLELATGANPFVRDDAGAVIRAHLEVNPPPAHETNPDLSRFLSEVITVLLAKDPAARFPSAEELRAVLAEGEKSPWWTERERELLKTERRLPRIPVRRETTLHGRDEDLAALREGWRSAQVGRGRVFLLEGEAGIGKTRLVDAFVQEVGVEDIHFLYGSYPPSGGLGGLSEGVIGKFGAAGLEEALAPYLTVTPSLVPAFAALLRHEAPPPGAEPLRGDALHAVACHLMRALAKEKPLLWVLDDLHFAPKDSRDLFLSLARASGPHRVLLVATARSGLPEEETANLSRLEEFRRLPLARLGARDVIGLLKDAFRSTALAEKLGGKIAYKSDGVPYFVFELIRGLKDGQFLRQMPDGTFVQTQVISDIQVPSAVRDLIEGRLQGLSESQRAILDVGAVQGLTFDPGLVAAVLEEKRVRVLRDLAEIERRLGLVRGEEGVCRFDQNQVQEVLYGALMPDLRSEYHAMLAEACAEREGVEGKDPKTLPGDTVLFLATHHMKGGRPRDGLPFLEPALDHIAEAYRHEAAADLAGRALGVKGLLAGKARVEMLLRFAGLLDHLGRRKEQGEALEEARGLAEEVGDLGLRVRARRSLGSHLHGIGRDEEGEPVLREALSLAQEAGDQTEEGRVLDALAAVAFRRGQYEEARRGYEAACASAAGVENRGLEASSMGGLGNALVSLGLILEGTAKHERSLVLHRDHGNRLGEAGMTINLGETSRIIGRLDRARERYGSSLSLCRETGLRTGECYSLHNLGETETVLGNSEGATSRLEASGALAAELGLRLILAYGLRARGDLAAIRGEEAEALRLHGESLDEARKAGYRPLEAEALVALGRLHAKAGRNDEAAARLGEAAAMAAEMGAPNEQALAAAIGAFLPGGDGAAAAKALADLGEKPWHTARMEARWWLWKATRDRAHLAESWRLLQHLRDHAPEECRVPMMERVPLHAAIAAAAKEASL